MSLNDARKDDIARDNRERKKGYVLPIEEAHIEKIVKKEAEAVCRPLIQTFAECARAQNLMVVFNCRDENLAMAKCMAYERSDEKCDQVRLRRIAEREAEAAAKRAEEEAAIKAAEKKKNAWW
mmetsp:Transcript_3567/g.7162  ORF Transcript_3567/g.7162 Transcript_3567/m.7162 type:complete len:123 (-) Transcript_3567:467-835(-)|eukprot:CAMPEP_0173386542 /NCGR_PEP_ID=MMETSP1356-20130122/9134_1 /TAXON_ID=77927 ORGANISM="Hemiselmis virescens, Strain PCC157" /NCGR_SAMPLE_ID=MMETSP1356 /ASSEMBLY_ACC=CAM_ASM_000847 /LENGTH=122 /DNA_ID=CAMNT_0014342817 /DNA_START=59 /DNA_END=427 /DNA_ORIENTATION=-